MYGFSLRLFLLYSTCFVMSNTYSSAAAAVSPPDTPTTDNILLNCGGPSKDFSLDGREWDKDSLPKILPTPDNLNTSISTPTEQNPSVELIPYSTARVFTSKFTYKIPVSHAGQKFLRLYFYPTHYYHPTNYSKVYDMTKSFFDVDAANHTLLFNFSASLNLHSPSLTLVKEYVITVNPSRVLEVTFTPSPSSYAFVNGIEVVSIPDKLYIKGYENDEDAIKMLGQKTRFYIEDSMALEKFYRLNVGGPNISSTNDTGMFRSWDGDQQYLVTSSLGLTPEQEFPIKYTPTTPSYMAPAIVYFSARTLLKENFGLNMTWGFQVDSGFIYLVRLFFCEIVDPVTQPNQRVFSIFINNQIAEEFADVIILAGGSKTPVYEDYVVLVGENPDGSKSKTDLLLTLRPNNKTDPQAENTILNGLEIFKLSQSGGSLALPNPESIKNRERTPLKTEKHGGSLVGACIGGSLGVMILFLLFVAFLSFRRRRENSKDIDTKSLHDKSRPTKTNISLLPTVRSLKFSVEEIKLATSNFDDNFVIGTGGFGNVYKGYVENGTYPVAIKRLSPSSRQGIHEFQTEIKILSNLRHIHLVPLIGYCDDSGEMILVYDYMNHGTLRSHLYGGNNPPVSWKQRLQICLGAARGLHYLHSSAERVIIHRDVKSTNILLDQNMVARVSDFGLSKMGPSNASITHVSTIVKGSFGYLDPEYYMRQQLTCKSDVYSFGVVLFEVLCARPVVMQDLPHEQVNLAEWARNCYREGRLGEILDKDLTGEISVESLKKFGEVGYTCLRNQGIDRPTMGEVVSSLEFALQLQESYEKLDQEINPNPGDQTEHLTSEAKDDLFSAKIVVKAKSTESLTKSSYSEGFKSGIESVFSEILKPDGR